MRADADLLGDPGPPRRVRLQPSHEVERVEPDGVLQVRRVDLGVGRNAEHLARRSVDDHLAGAGICDDGAIRHGVHGVP